MVKIQILSWITDNFQGFLPLANVAQSGILQCISAGKLQMEFNEIYREYRQ